MGMVDLRICGCLSAVTTCLNS